MNHHLSLKEEVEVNMVAVEEKARQDLLIGILMAVVHLLLMMIEIIIINNEINHGIKIKIKIKADKELIGTIAGDQIQIK